MKDKKKILRDVDLIAKEIAMQIFCDDGEFNTKEMWEAISRIKAYVMGRSEEISVKEFMTYNGNPL